MGESAPDFVANGDEDTKSSMDSEAADQQPPVTEQQELTEAKNHTQEEVSLPEAPKPSAVAAVIEEEVTQTPAPVALDEVTKPSEPVVAAEVEQTSAPIVAAEVTEPPPSAPVAEANGSEKAEVISTTTQETPKTNGNNSHSSNE